MKIKDPKYSYIQDSDNCRIYALLHAYSYATDKKVEPLKIIQEMKDKNKTLINMLIDGDLGEKVKIRRFAKSTPATLIEHLNAPMCASIALYKEINYSRRIIAWRKEQITHRAFHEIFVYGIDYKTNRILFLNSWEKDQRQEMSFDFFFHCLRFYFLIHKMKKLETNKELQPVRAIWQSDPKHRNFRLGKSRLTIGSHGCLVCSLCMALERLRGTPADPISAVKHWHFAVSGNLMWSKTVFKGMTYHARTTNSVVNISKHTTNQEACLVEVRKKNIPQHFVFVDCVINNDVWILDPLDGKRKTLNTSGYTTVSVRLLKKK